MGDAKSVQLNLDKEALPSKQTDRERQRGEEGDRSESKKMER